jgi:hypothetical protein
MLALGNFCIITPAACMGRTCARCFTLLCCAQAHACSPTVFALPAVQAVINFKWTSWARQFLLYELFCYCLWLACFTAFTLLFQAEDWTMTLWESMQDR